jgi:nicotinate dehydrogenase subunit A
MALSQMAALRSGTGSRNLPGCSGVIPVRRTKVQINATESRVGDTGLHLGPLVRHAGSMDAPDSHPTSAQSISFTLNGRAVSVTAPETAPLLDVLRNQLDLKGTRFGCGAEQCGCCMVLIDGSPEKSCGKPLWTVAHRTVVTIEGLGTRDCPHPLQQAFLDEQAGQCGYCLAGILISAKALLDRNPSPSRREVAEALDGNICRCGSHNRIMRAVLKAAELLRCQVQA